MTNLLNSNPIKFLSKNILNLVIVVALFGLLYVAVMALKHTLLLLLSITPRVASIISAAAIYTAAVRVFTALNPVHALLGLIAVFFLTSLFMLNAKAEFVAYTFLIVYVGAIAILFLFVIMLLDIKDLTAAKFVRLNPLTGFGVILTYFFGSFVLYTGHDYFIEFSDYSNAVELVTEPTSASFLTNFVNHEFRDILLFSNFLYSYYAVIFSLLALLLLTAILGAIVLATTTADDTRAKDISAGPSPCGLRATGGRAGSLGSRRPLTILMVNVLPNDILVALTSSPDDGVFFGVLTGVAFFWITVRTFLYKAKGPLSFSFFFFSSSGKNAGFAGDWFTDAMTWLRLKWTGQSFKSFGPQPPITNATAYWEYERKVFNHQLSCYGDWVRLTNPVKYFFGAVDQDIKELQAHFSSVMAGDADPKYKCPEYLAEYFKLFEQTWVVVFIGRSKEQGHSEFNLRDLGSSLLELQQARPTRLPQPISGARVPIVVDEPGSISKRPGGLNIDGTRRTAYGHWELQHRFYEHFGVRTVNLRPHDVPYSPYFHGNGVPTTLGQSWTKYPASALFKPQWSEHGGWPQGRFVVVPQNTGVIQNGLPLSCDDIFDPCVLFVITLLSPFLCVGWGIYEIFFATNDKTVYFDETGWPVPWWENK